MTNHTGTKTETQESRTLAAWELEALATLRPGDGREQSRKVRTLLRRAEAAGLARYSSADGWRLTPAGVLACEIARVVSLELEAAE